MRLKFFVAALILIGEYLLIHFFLGLEMPFYFWVLLCVGSLTMGFSSDVFAWLRSLKR